VRKKQRVMAIIMVAVMIFAMVGSTIFGYFWGGYQYSQGADPAETISKSGEASPDQQASDYESLKYRVADLNQQVEGDPQNLDLWQDLGDAYYDLAVAALDSAPNEVTADLQQAVDVYQYVLQNKKDVNVMLDLATAAYYLGDDDLAQKSFQDALQEQPDNFYALYNYGMFLHDAKQDFSGALVQWERALAVNPDDQQLRDIIAGTKIELEEANESTSP